MKFRFHRGSLADAMATQFEFTDKQDLINKIHEKGGWNELNESTFRCKFYGYDKRINENTHIVECWVNEDNHYVIGMTDGMVK